ncbi:MAG TPA: hypothetical protein VED59_08040 [Acidimicrobiales bacterium]|nr:hypothetical protein [Acidimicrobiales bacterium]
MTGRTRGAVAMPAPSASFHASHYSKTRAHVREKAFAALVLLTALVVTVVLLGLQWLSNPA